MIDSVSKSESDQKEMSFELISPEKTESRSLEEKIVLPGSEGEFTVLPGHTKLVTNLINGLIRIIRADSDTQQFYITGGFVDISPDQCVVLAKSVKPIHELKEKELRDRLQLLEEDLQEKSNQNNHAIHDEMKEIQNQLKALESSKL